MEAHLMLDRMTETTDCHPNRSNQNMTTILCAGSNNRTIPSEETKLQIKEYWNTGYLQDQFFLDLVKVTSEIKKLGNYGVTGEIIKYRKYYRQAICKMYRIPLTNQYPKTKEEAVIFKIKFSDLSPRVQEEFIDYCRLYDKGQVSVFLKQVVIRLFENLDYDYAHKSIMKKLRISVIR